MHCGWAMDGEPNAEPVELHLPIMALLDMPYTAAFAKALGRRCFKVTRTPPIAITSAHGKSFKVIRLLSHNTILLSSVLLAALAPSTRPLSDAELFNHRDQHGVLIFQMAQDHFDL